MLTDICRTISKRVFNRISQRNICTSTSVYKAYEAEGKTTANILNNEEDIGLMVNGYSQAGFRLNNDITVLGSIAIFPKSVLSWNVNHIRDVTEESLTLFSVLEPKLEIVVLGIGDKNEERCIYDRLFPFMKKHKINLEILPTDIACSTFNFLNSEGRYIAAGLIPPVHIQTTDNDILESKLRYSNLYEVQE